MDVPAAGLGQRPPSVISSDQEYPPLEHKEIPVPSPYARRIQQQQQTQELHGQSKAGPKTPPKSTAILEAGKTTARSNTEHTTESNCKGQDVYKFQEAVITNERVAVEPPRNETPLINEKIMTDIGKERQSLTDVQCAKTVSNAKNDQIRVSMREKLAKNKEEVSEKRSSFSEVDKPNNHTDRAVFPSVTTPSPGVTVNQLNSALTERLDNSKDANYTPGTVNFITRNSVNEIGKISIDTLDKANVDRDNDELEQVQTTWELEKQKADQLAIMRLSENSVADLSRHFTRSQSSTPPVSASPIQTKENDVSDDHRESESSLMEDTDESSDAKTITNLEGPPALENDDSNRRYETPVKPVVVSQAATVTPDTMTPDEAENLLSSR